MSDIRDKCILRKQFLDWRKSLDGEFASACALRIQQHLSGEDLSSFLHVMLYQAHDKEISVMGLINCFHLGTRFYTPVVREDGFIIPVEVSEDTRYVKGKYRILIPKEGIEGNRSDLNLVFVPGIVFDNTGFRIGYGKGYYDRFLRDLNTVKVGCCYQFQVQNRLDFREEQDISMDALLTEEGFKWLR